MKRALLPGSALVLAVLAVYSPTFDAGFVSDDVDYIIENPFLTQRNALRQIWFSLEVPSQYFPMTYTVFRFEHALWGLNPIGYHLVNVLLHAANALLVGQMLVRLAVPGAWLAAGLFALHPVNVESVAWISELKNVLSVFFCLTSAHAWLSFIIESNCRRRLAYTAALVLFILALFSKTTVLVLPAGLLVLCTLRGQRIGRRRLLQLAPFAILALAFGLLTVWWEHNRGGTTGREFDFSIPERIIIVSRSFWFSLGKLLWPAGLTLSYPKWAIDSRDAWQYLPAAALAGAAGALWRWRVRLGRSAGGALAFYAAALAPTLGFISYYTQHYTFVADHYQYLGSVALLALAAAAAVGVTGPGATAPLRRAPLLVLLSALGLLSWQRVPVYRDEETLWKDTIARNPGA